MTLTPNTSQFDTAVPVIELERYTPDGKTLEFIKESTSRKLKVLPLFQAKKLLVVAMVNSLDYEALNELKRETGLDIYPVSVNETALLSALGNYYKRVDSLQEELRPILQNIKGSKTATDEKQIHIKSALSDEQKPVIQLVNSLVKQAVKIGASDIHIEPDEKLFRIRYRVDGLLQEQANFPIEMFHYIVSRIKVISNLDITESRLPQDGRAKLLLDEKEIDLRISTFPTIYGENVVIRVLDRSVLNFNMNALGLSEEILPPFIKAINAPYGIILVAGPTGSGKTTSLYAILNTINEVSKNIVTVEDPVEVNMQMVRQSQVNPKVGLTFASGLRSILRQDPDVIMVGEIRDLETAEIAIQAALTGHLVFSTIHTNDAPSTMARLTDMGTEPFLLASAINAILAQRLVRKLCPVCKELYTPDKNLLELLGLEQSPETVFYRAKGCMQCRNMGYSGRIGIYELMFINDDIRELIAKRAPSEEIKQAAMFNGMLSMSDDGLQKVLAGITSIDEVMRVTKLNMD